jgi:hypothetical protein
MAALENIGDQPYEIEAGTRLLQICSPMLLPAKAQIVTSLDETSRGSGGFGSTGTGLAKKTSPTNECKTSSDETNATSQKTLNDTHE